MGTWKVDEGMAWGLDEDKWIDDEVTEVKKNVKNSHSLPSSEVLGMFQRA